MRDGKALQMGTSHELGQNFARAFGTTFLDGEGAEELVWQTSWGVSTRLVGGLIMAHGDDRGLVVPPRLAPTQVTVIVVRDQDDAAERARLMAEELKADGIRVAFDDRVESSFGWRSTEWELKGVPVRLEVGPRDLASEMVTLVRRDTGEKRQVSFDGMRAEVEATLELIQHDLLERAIDRRDEALSDVASIEEAREAGQSGWARIPWSAVGTDGETTLHQQGLGVRCLQRRDGSLPAGPDDTDALVAYVARAY